LLQNIDRVDRIKSGFSVQGSVARLELSDRINTSVLEQLSDKFPEHTFSTCPATSPSAAAPQQKTEESAFHWTLCGMDGIENYLREYPIHCISLMLSINGEPYLAIIYDAIHDELYTALAQNSAKLNEKRLRRHAHESQPQGILAHNNCLIPDSLTTFTKGFQVRSIGCNTLSAAYVASGRFDFFYGCNIPIDDFSPALLLLQEAKAQVTSCISDENPNFYQKLICIGPTPYQHLSLI